MSEALERGDRVRITEPVPLHVPIDAVDHTARVTSINLSGGIYVQEECRPIRRYYVPPWKVTTCLERLP